MLIAMLIAMIVIGIASIYAAACLKHISAQIVILSQQVNGPTTVHELDRIDSNIDGLHSLTARNQEKILEELEAIRKGRRMTKTEEKDMEDVHPFYRE